MNASLRITGDRQRLHQAIRATVIAREVLYPGSYVEVAPSIVYPDVTYVDVDKRAAAFFSDVAGVQEIIAMHGGDPLSLVQFIHSDNHDIDHFMIPKKPEVVNRESILCAGLGN